MSFVSTGFVFYCFLTVVLYYLVPQKLKWLILLIASYIFYALNNLYALIFIVASTFVSYIIALRLSSIANICEEKRNATTDKQERKTIKIHYNTIKKRYLILALFFLYRYSCRP
jgi:hypothetical protein